MSMIKNRSQATPGLKDGLNFTMLDDLNRYSQLHKFAVTCHDSDVGDIVMLATDLRCWWQNNYVVDFFRYVGDFVNVFNRSPTS